MVDTTSVAEMQLIALRALRLANTGLGMKPLLAKLRDQQPECELSTKEMREMLRRLDEEAVASGQAEHPPVSDDEINGMLAKREDARRRRDWEVADGIKVFLRQNGIQVWDADKMWKSNDGSRSGTFG